MGKIKTVNMGDIVAEEKAREKAAVKREQKKKEKAESKSKKEVQEQSPVPSSQLPQQDEPDISSPISEKPEGIEKSKIGKQRSESRKSKVESRYHFKAGKKYTTAASLVDRNKTYSLPEALDLVKKTSYSKFDSSVELHLNATDKGLRGNVQLPHGTGKSVRIKIADDALISNLEKGGRIDFDVLVSSPELMPKLARIAKILGPKGLMPNPKTNTISSDPEKLVKSLTGSLSWKTEPNFPIIHAVLGKVSFENKKLEENYQALVKSIGKDKITSAFLKATMGPAIRLMI